MYDAFYGLSERPFNLTPDPRYLFLSEKHKEAFAHLLYGIRNRMGFIMVSGEIGTGKTTICRSLLAQLDADTEIAFIFNPFLSPEELLRTINEDFGISSRAGSMRELIDELNQYLLDRNSKGKNCVLVIDEAQNLSPSVLEQIRPLSNLETETQKLLQIVLIGQPELAQILQLPELRQLNQRITARYHLKPLDFEETLQYIAYRIRVAGGRKKVHFTRGAIKAIFKASGGTPRVINSVSDRALLVGYTREVREITTDIVKRAVKEIRGETVKQRRRIPWPALQRFLPNPTLLVSAVLIILLVRFLAPYPYRQAAAPSAPEQTQPVPIPGSALLPPAPVEAAKAGPMSLRADLSERAVPDGAAAPRLVAMNADAARTRALETVLGLWNVRLAAASTEDSPDALIRAVTAHGLACELLAPSLDELQAVGLPALIRLRTGDAGLWTGLVEVTANVFRLTTDSNETVLIGGETLRKLYGDQALIPWRDPARGASALRRFDVSPEVRSLQDKLHALARLPEGPSGVYDDQTVRAVARLQVETGLKIGGVAGRQVRMVLSSWLPSPGTPSIRAKWDPATALSIRTEPAAPPVKTASAPPRPEKPPVPLPDFSKDAPGVTAPPKAMADDEGLPPYPASMAAIDMAVPEHPFHAGPAAPARSLVQVRDLPPPARDDTLPPPKVALPKEVTPPLDGNTVLAPRESADTALAPEAAR